ncbi:TIGR03905 family TSCPD domain-containing protein [Romboutsia sp. CE17]|uniref:TIGR03905 family TSCPD domain-containing protein n=1 Tax=Romboutsia sp. CE17 TaxID=2724150 RepID=UPI001442B14E|nr:TIGR03905 family TSCPD domain-containing protein [Romboutsia sp. CE17]QJA08974.1 TIGR03905 family TSCPD domain-containing protein [Romboutsia sp. CE17]
MYRYYTKGVCSKSILMNIEGDILKDVVFEDGCAGNLIALKHLIEGKSIDNIIDALENIPCKDRGTSCPDQLAKALKIYKKYVYEAE